MSEHEGLEGHRPASCPGHPAGNSLHDEVKAGRGAAGPCKDAARLLMVPGLLVVARRPDDGSLEVAVADGAEFGSTQAALVPERCDGSTPPSPRWFHG